MKYRICVINDFNNVTSVVDFQKYGIIESLTAWQVSSKHRGYQLNEDSIHIFCNFEKISSIKVKSDAKGILSKLIGSCPQEAKKNFEEYSEILYKSLE